MLALPARRNRWYDYQYYRMRLNDYSRMDNKMMCYRDRTFCGFYSTCKKGDNCAIALTPEIIENANKWWGGPDAPICSFVDHPSCFEEKQWTHILKCQSLKTTSLLEWPAQHSESHILKTIVRRFTHRSALWNASDGVVKKQCSNQKRARCNTIAAKSGISVRHVTQNSNCTK